MLPTPTLDTHVPSEQLERYVKLWREAAFSTVPSPRHEVEVNIARAYIVAGLKRPQVVWCDSPLSMLLMYGAIQGIHGLYQVNGLEMSFIRQFRMQLRNIEVGALVSDIVQNAVIKRVENDVPAFQRDQSSYFAWTSDNFRADYSHPLLNGLSRTLIPFEGHLRGMARLLHNDLELKTNREESKLTRPVCLGQMDAGRMAMYAYCHEVIGIGALSPLYPLYQIAMNAGWWIPCENVCFVSERPTSMLFDDNGRLHSANSAALTYADGYSLYAWRGMSIPSVIITNPERVNVEMIENERNSELKRVLIERYGAGRYLEESGFHILAQDEYGVLVHKEQRGDEPIVMVKVLNSTPEPDGTHKTYWLPVPPRYVQPDMRDEDQIGRYVGAWGARDWASPKEAIAWTWGLSEADYNPTQES